MRFAIVFAADVDEVKLLTMPVVVVVVTFFTLVKPAFATRSIHVEPLTAVEDVPEDELALTLAFLLPLFDEDLLLFEDDLPPEDDEDELPLLPADCANSRRISAVFHVPSGAMDISSALTPVKRNVHELTAVPDT